MAPRDTRIADDAAHSPPPILRWLSQKRTDGYYGTLFVSRTRGRTNPADLSTYWISHLDPHVTILLSHTGPFATSTDENRPGEILPDIEPPRGRFSPDLQG
ncbi:DUF4913 domain-containing protein [Rathayibacter sp. SD072]|uniref:DUF4913 domain-containing protein n=1 Tax=Rathayibacter sp. SD072 TaxID=2781731 RepID=UPI001A96DEBA|nr:DUF4913 domain-containing protein [Rathayibacter sp. SD072]